LALTFGSALVVFVTAEPLFIALTFCSAPARTAALLQLLASLSEFGGSVLAPVLFPQPLIITTISGQAAVFWLALRLVTVLSASSAFMFAGWVFSRTETLLGFITAPRAGALPPLPFLLAGSRWFWPSGTGIGVGSPLAIPLVPAISLRRFASIGTIAGLGIPPLPGWPASSLRASHVAVAHLGVTPLAFFQSLIMRAAESIFMCGFTTLPW
jgi:hypothetical protein